MFSSNPFYRLRLNCVDQTSHRKFLMPAMMISFDLISIEILRELLQRDESIAHSFDGLLVEHGNFQKEKYKKGIIMERRIQ